MKFDCVLKASETEQWFEQGLPCKWFMEVVDLETWEGKWGNEAGKSRREAELRNRLQSAKGNWGTGYPWECRICLRAVLTEGWEGWGPIALDRDWSLGESFPSILGLWFFYQIRGCSCQRYQGLWLVLLEHKSSTHWLMNSLSPGSSSGPWTRCATRDKDWRTEGSTVLDKVPRWMGVTGRQT